MKRSALNLLCVLAAVILGLPGVVPAQDATNEMRLSLSECVDIALDESPDLALARYGVAIAERGVDASRSSFYPSISASWSTSRSVNGPQEGTYLDQTTGKVVQTIGESRVSGSQGLSVGGLSIPLYDAGILAGLSASKQGLRASQMDQEVSRQDVVFSVKQAYFNLLKAMKLLEVQQEQVRVAEESLKRNETLYEIGSTAISELYSARANLASAQAMLISRENTVAIRRTELSFSMGLGMGVTVAPAEEEFEVKAPRLTYEAAVGAALEGHPSILSDMYSMLQARESLKGTRRGLRHPTVRLTGGSFSWSLAKGEQFRGLEDLFLKNYRYSFGVSVSFPLFNMSTENNIRRQTLQYLRSQEQLDKTKRQKAQDLRQSYLSLELQRRSIAANEASVKASEENYQLAEERYNLGAGTYLERLQAQRDLFSARNNLVQVIYDYQIELARLEQRSGTSVAMIEAE